MKPFTLLRRTHALYPSFIHYQHITKWNCSTAKLKLDDINIDKSKDLTSRLTNSNESISTFTDIINPSRIGKVKEITNTIVTVEGFTSSKPYSLVSFDNGVNGLVLTVDEYGSKIGIIDNGVSNKLLKINDRIGIDTNILNIQMSSPSTIVGPGIIGRIVDIYGNDFKDIQYSLPNQYSSCKRAQDRDLDDMNSNSNASYQLPVWNVNLFPNSKYVTDWYTYSLNRERIHTGIKSIDTFYPFAKGLRTGIIGKKYHRKSELAIDILLSFMNHNKSTDNMFQKMYGVYVMIGKPVDEIWRLYNILFETGGLEYTTIVVSRNDDYLTKQYLTPYTGAAIADFYKFHKMNSFIIYDDFTVHNSVTSKIFRESTYLMSYGNWSGELLERSAQINRKYGNGSHTALCIADKPQDGDDELNAESEVFYNYLPHLVSHVDQTIMLNDESYDSGLVPPISLFPVPYGTPKFMNSNNNNNNNNDDENDEINKNCNEILLKLSISVKKKLFSLVELEEAARNQIELDIDLEPDVERISSNVYKFQILFTQNEEINIFKLLLILYSISNNLVEYVHIDKINNVENELYKYFINKNGYGYNEWNKICKSIQKYGNKYENENNDNFIKLFNQFLDDNNDLCKPNALSKQNLEQLDETKY